MSKQGRPKTSSHFSPCSVSTCPLCLRLLNPVLEVNTLFFRLQQASDVLFSISSESWRDSTDLSGPLSLPCLSLQRSIRPCLRVPRVIFPLSQCAPHFLCLVFQSRSHSVDPSARPRDEGKNRERHTNGDSTPSLKSFSEMQLNYRLKSNQIKSLLLSHHHSTCALVSEILESVLHTVQNN